MDSKTLQDRVNDAIDTIIRKEDALESGDLLQPCIEGTISQPILIAYVSIISLLIVGPK